FAPISPRDQPTAARKGRVTRSAATSNGRRIAAPVPCAPSSAVERNDTVISTSESSTRPPTTIRRLRALERLEGEPGGAARGTEKPRAARRTDRVRGP